MTTYLVYFTKEAHPDIRLMLAVKSNSYYQAVEHAFRTLENQGHSFLKLKEVVTHAERHTKETLNLKAA